MQTIINFIVNEKKLHVANVTKRIRTKITYNKYVSISCDKKEFVLLFSRTKDNSKLFDSIINSNDFDLILIHKGCITWICIDVMEEIKKNCSHIDKEFIKKKLDIFYKNQLKFIQKTLFENIICYFCNKVTIIDKCTDCNSCRSIFICRDCSSNNDVMKNIVVVKNSTNDYIECPSCKNIFRFT